MFKVSNGAGLWMLHKLPTDLCHSQHCMPWICIEDTESDYLYKEELKIFLNSQMRECIWEGALMPTWNSFDIASMPMYAIVEALPSEGTLVQPCVGLWLWETKKRKPFDVLFSFYQRILGLECSFCPIYVSRLRCVVIKRLRGVESKFKRKI